MKLAARWFVFQNNGLLLLSRHNQLPTDTDLMAISPHFLRRFSLGERDGVHYHCAEISKTLPIHDEFQITPLKTSLSIFEPDKYGLIVKAYSILNWDKNHQFCSCCGNVTVLKAKAFERACAPCGLAFFPRISPSIIVLIQKEDHVLMARSPHFAPGVYALIAGFVESGESAEETVHREVLEEVGIHIKNLSYYGSQPWPFQDSLMIAFKADYASGDIVIDREEIEEAGWYRYDNLPGRPSTPASISSKLLDDYISHATKIYGAR